MTSHMFGSLKKELSASERKNLKSGEDLFMQIKILILGKKLQTKKLSL